MQIHIIFPQSLLSRLGHEPGSGRGWQIYITMVELVKHASRSNRKNIVRDCNIVKISLKISLKHLKSILFYICKAMSRNSHLSGFFPGILSFFNSTQLSREVRHTNKLPQELDDYWGCHSKIEDDWKDEDVLTLQIVEKDKKPTKWIGCIELHSFTKTKLS